MATGATNRPRPQAPGQALALRADKEPAIPATSQAGYIVARTSPGKLVRHDISDEQLTMLVSGGRSFQRDILWVALGTASGAAVPAISAISALGKATGNFGYWELLECGIFASALAVFVVMLLVIGREPDGAAALARAIRERTAKEMNAADGTAHR